mmetsp:Transcript_23322/g.22955  ORF Transcript_23322/g.22955 Transcript_23322/m.22955 type:complete len:113 (-) Transcript_23322:1121-1459(-)
MLGLFALRVLAFRVLVALREDLLLRAHLPGRLLPFFRLILAFFIFALFLIIVLEAAPLLALSRLLRRLRRLLGILGLPDRTTFALGLGAFIFSLLPIVLSLFLIIFCLALFL